MQRSKDGSIFVRKYQMKVNKKEIVAGFKSGIPIILGFIPVGIAYAIIAKNAGLTTLETVFMSVSVFAGASQMMAAGMYAEGAGITAIVIATLIINLRHVIMSTCVFNSLEQLSAGKKLFCSFFVTDESFAVVTSRKEHKTSFVFMATLGLVTYLSWVVGSVIGALAVNILPDVITASLGISLYAMFIGLLFPGVRGNVPLIILVIGVAVLNTVLSKLIPSGWAIVVSTLAGASAGTFFVELDGYKNEKGKGGENES